MLRINYEVMIIVVAQLLAQGAWLINQMMEIAAVGLEESIKVLVKHSQYLRQEKDQFRIATLIYLLTLVMQAGTVQNVLTMIAD